MKVTVSKKMTFDSAHHLVGYKGKCARPHGHSWDIEVGVSGPVRSDTNMVVDFKDLGLILKKQIVDRLDHTDLNDFFIAPTAENITSWAFTLLSPLVRDLEVELEFVRIWESPDSCCEVRG